MDSREMQEQGITCDLDLTGVESGAESGVESGVELEMAQDVLAKSHAEQQLNMCGPSRGPSHSTMELLAREMAVVAGNATTEPTIKDSLIVAYSDPEMRRRNIR